MLLVETTLRIPAVPAIPVVLVQGPVYHISLGGNDDTDKITNAVAATNERI